MPPVFPDPVSDSMSANRAASSIGRTSIVFAADWEKTLPKGFAKVGRLAGLGIRARCLERLSVSFLGDRPAVCLFTQREVASVGTYPPAR